MYTTSISSNGTRDAHVSHEVTQQRVRTQETVQTLSVSAMRQWEKALTGLVALPAAAALSTAAVTLLAASLVERTFEVLENTVAGVGRGVGWDHEVRGDHRDDGRSNVGRPTDKDIRS